MSSIALILALSAIIWYVIDRVKVVWAGIPYGKYITTTMAAILGSAVVFGYNLDLIHAMGIVGSISIVGKIITVFAFMCGSSAISEIIARIKPE
jgi:hypothetical protein